MRFYKKISSGFSEVNPGSKNRSRDRDPGPIADPWFQNLLEQLKAAQKKITNQHFIINTENLYTQMVRKVLTLMS